MTPRDRDRWWAVAACGTLAVIGLVTASTKVFWLDEFFSFNTALRSLSGTWHQALTFELQPPVYFLLLHGWLKMGATAFVGRTLSLAAGVATVAILVRTGRTAGITSPWIQLGAWAAITPAIVWAASEARTYAVAMMFLSGALYFFVALWMTDQRRSMGRYVGFVLCGYLALLTNYYSGFVLAGLLGAGAISGRRLRPLVACYGALTLLFLPWVPTVLTQMSLHPTSYGSPDLPFGPDHPGAGVGVVVGWLWSTLLRSVLHGPIVERPMVLAVAALGLACLLVARLSQRPRWTVAESMMAVAAAIPAGTLLALEAFQLAYVDTRHWSVTVPAALLLVALVTQHTAPVAQRVGAGLVVLGLAAGTVSTLRNLNALDWPGAANYVQRHGTPDETVIVFPSHGLGPFDYYFRGYSPLTAIPAPEPLISPLTIGSLQEVRASVAAIVDPGTPFWLLIEPVAPYTGVGFVTAYLSELEVLDSHEVPGLSIHHVRLP